MPQLRLTTDLRFVLTILCGLGQWLPSVWGQSSNDKPASPVPDSTPTPIVSDHPTVFQVSATTQVGNGTGSKVEILAWATADQQQILKVIRGARLDDPPTLLKVSFFRVDSSQLQIQPKHTSRLEMGPLGPEKWLSEFFFDDLPGIDLTTLTEVQVEVNGVKSRRAKLAVWRKADPSKP